MNQHIVILRLSSKGDVAIAAPLVRAYAVANPEIQFTMVSQSLLGALFEGVPNLHFCRINYYRDNWPMWRAIRLAKEIKKLNPAPTKIIDLQDSERTKLIRWLVAPKDGVSIIWKSRFSREALSRKEGKILQQVSTTQRRYEKVFSDAGLRDLEFAKQRVEKHKPTLLKTRNIGIAPFARHQSKQWPLEYMEEVVARLSKEPDTKIFLFGGCKNEASLLDKWENKYYNTESIAGKHTMKEELEYMNNLDVMISMDSANLHFASFVKTPVISVWGGTHLYAGFYGWGQDTDLALQIDLDCRPCSVNGEKDCFRDKNRYQCLTAITPDMLLNKIDSYYNELSN